jgi:hypothetical protein
VLEFFLQVMKGDVKVGDIDKKWGLTDSYGVYHDGK